jgi:hypothetical protein
MVAFITGAAVRNQSASTLASASCGLPARLFCIATRVPSRDTHGTTKPDPAVFSICLRSVPSRRTSHSS